MEIEQLAVERPEALARVAGRPAHRHRRGEGRARSSPPAGFPAERRRPGRRRPAEALGRLRRARTPRWSRSTRWCKTADGEIVALDGKVTLDENADFRHPEHAALEDKAAADPLEAAAKEKGLNYVKLDGEVGIIGNGAGLVMSTLDVVAYAGEEFGGRRSPRTSSTSAAAPRPR